MAPSSQMLIFALCFVAVSASETNPVTKVITLLEELQTSVTDEGKKEAETYDKFACYCKDTTGEKAESITSGQDTIDENSATIQQKTAEKAVKISDLKERQQKGTELGNEMDAEVADCERSKAEYDASSADMTAAITALEGAIESMKGSKGSASLLQGMHESVVKSLAIADALNFIDSKKQQVITNFLEGSTHVDPADAGYKFHSQSVIDLLEKLEKQFNDKKGELDEVWEKTEKACTDTKKSLSDEMLENKDAMDTLNEDISGLDENIAEARESLVNAESQLKDDQTYLKELTGRCENSAQDWDQRSGLRKNELEALSKALAILNDRVKDADAEVNERAAAALIVKSKKMQAGWVMPKNVTKAAPAKAAAKPVSFLQGSSARGSARAFLERVQGSLTTTSRRDQAIALLSNEGVRLSSPALTALSSKVRMDPFVKVKNLIQKLIERLIKEATEEATKKGFCDTELGKSMQNRDARHADGQKLEAELSALEAKQEELEQEIEELGVSLKELNEAHAKAAKLRSEEKEENIENIKTAKGGLEAITEAINILKVFYKQSAKASLAQVQGNKEDPGFEGSYKGNQDASKSIVGLLEVIQSDFARTISTIKKSEEDAAAEFVEFDRTSKADIGGKETKVKLDKQDLEATKNALTSKMEDLKSNQLLLDGALKELEELKPACVDTGMSSKEREEKREEEIDALKKALCLLDPEGKEEDCK